MKLFANTFHPLILIFGLICLTSCGDEDYDYETHQQKKYLSKITVSSDISFENYTINFTYNNDNTLNKYAVSSDLGNEILSCVFSYNQNRKLTITDIYENGFMTNKLIYNYLPDNILEVSSTSERNNWEFQYRYIYELNQKGYPETMERAAFMSGNTLYPKITKTYNYNPDNTLSNTSELLLYEDYGRADTYKTKYTYAPDTYNPLRNLPAGNYYLYENLLINHSLPITGIGALIANCTGIMVTLNNTYNTEDYQSSFEYGEDGFPVTATINTTIEDRDENEYILTFEYIIK